MRSFFESLASRLVQNLRTAAKPFRLRHIILICVLFSMLITELIVISGTYIIWSNDQFRRLDEETLLMLKANVDMTSFPTLDQTVKMGQRISSFSAVRGGTIYNQLGEQIASFGQKPGLSMITFQREGIRHLISADKDYLDVFYPIEITGLANPMVLRIDARRIPAILQQQLHEKFTLTLAVAFVSSLVIVFFLSFTIVGPILKMRDAVLSATDNPDKADLVRLNWKRKDEFGDVSRALDLLFTTVSVVHQEDLAAGQEATHRSAFPVLTYDRSGKLMNANEAALKFFGVAAQSDLAHMSHAYIRMKTASGILDVSPISVMSEGDVHKTVNIVTPNGLKRCKLNGVVIHKRTGAILRYIVTLIDVTHNSLQIDSLKKHIKQLTSQTIDSARRLAEMRGLFQSCLILISRSSEESPRRAEADSETAIVLTDRIVNAWCAEALRGHLIKAQLSHAALPPVRGVPERIEAVFRQAFMYVYARARVEQPSIHIKADITEESFAVFEVWEEPAGPLATPRIADETLAAGATLSEASLRCSIEMAGGKFIISEEAKNHVRFTLPAAPLSEATSLKNMARAARFRTS